MTKSMQETLSNSLNNQELRNPALGKAFKKLSLSHGQPSPSTPASTKRQADVITHFGILLVDRKRRSTPKL